MVTFTFLGAGAINSAFLLAFMLPNLFRRLLGEGALTSALIPILSEEHHKHGKEEAFRFLNKLITWVSLGMVMLILLVIAGLNFVDHIPNLEPRWYLGAKLGMILIPYMLFVCLAAAFAAALNVFERFGIAASSQIWLNLAMIIALGVFGYLFGKNAEEQVYYLCTGVLIGGLIQVIWPAVALMRSGWKPKFDLSPSPALSSWFKLFIPGFGGAAIYQINFMVTQLLAFWLTNSAVATLYLANRLIQLPQGLFTISLVTVFFPSLSKLVIQGDKKSDLKDLYLKGLRMLMVVTIPATVGLIVLREPILSLLFEWGQFDAENVRATGPILAIVALSLPFFALSTLSTRGFHSLQDTRTPYKIGMVMFGINLILSVALMFPYGVAGLALANLTANIIQTILLQVKLTAKEESFSLKGLGAPMIQIGFAACSMIITLYLMLFAWESAFSFNGKLFATVAILTVIPGGMLIYFATLWILGYEDKHEFKRYCLLILKRRKASS